MNLSDTFDTPRHAQLVRTDRHSPCGVCVFIKSLHLVAAAWFASVMWLWLALDNPAAAGGAGIFAHAALPAVGLVMMALWMDQWVRRAGADGRSPAHEWEHAIAWAIVPMGFLFGMAFVLIG